MVWLFQVPKEELPQMQWKEEYEEATCSIARATVMTCCSKRHIALIAVARLTSQINKVCLVTCDQKCVHLSCTQQIATAVPCWFRVCALPHTLTPNTKGAISLGVVGSTCFVGAAFCEERQHRTPARQHGLP